LCRVLVVDEHPVCRLGVTQVLSSADDFEVVGEAGNGLDAIEAVDRLAPDMVLMGLSMPVLDGYAALAQIAQRFPDVSVVVLTSSSRVGDVFEAVELGASGYLLKTAEPDELVVELRAACRGALPISPTMTREMLKSLSAPVTQLTAREMEVLGFVVDGDLNKQIARQLSISERTVKTHLTHIYSKIGVEDRAAAVAWAVRNLSL
jgi:DNA-binding NarL/FixJ family response regulator